MNKNTAEIGIFGGSGFYDLAKNLKEIKIETPYGPPSDKISIGVVTGRKVAFLPRHGKSHDIPPHKINYRANIWALKSLGVNHIITVTAVGSLQLKYKPGSFVILDQFIDRTYGRVDTFYDGPIVTHISSAYPYCSEVTKVIYKEGQKMGLDIYEKGTVVVVNGPRFSTAAESMWYTKMGWDVINMTQYPEVVLAKEVGVGYSTIAIVTDYDAGIIGLNKIKPVSVNDIGKIFSKTLPMSKKLVLKTIASLPKKMICKCHLSLKDARF